MTRWIQEIDWIRFYLIFSVSQAYPIEIIPDVILRGFHGENTNKRVVWLIQRWLHLSGQWVINMYRKLKQLTKNSSGCFVLSFMMLCIGNDPSCEQQRTGNSTMTTYPFISYHVVQALLLKCDLSLFSEIENTLKVRRSTSNSAAQLYSISKSNSQTGFRQLQEYW